MELQFFFKSLFAATFILITTFPSSRCEENENFTTCSRPYECGEIKNLYFPFWGDGRPEICGHPGFNLSCINNEYPVIHIQGLDYRLLNVCRENNTMTLARLDLWDNPCSPDTSKNTTLDYIVFVNYPPTVVNLTLIYDCKKPEESRGLYFPNNFSCPGNDDRISYYARNDSQLQDLAKERLISDPQGGVIQVPAFRTALDEIERSADDGFGEVDSVLRKGFDLNYMEFPFCKECESSGGRCGSNNSNGMFTCYCSGRTEYLLVCPHSSDEKFAACAPQTCGNGQEISYPFWLSHQQESFCGYPNFEIICSHENPILRISNDDYIIKEIFYSNHSFLVANAAVYNEKCSVPQNNFSLDGTPFSFRSDPVNFSFFYNCTSEPSEKIFPYRVNCVSNETHHSFAAFHVEALQHMNYSFSSCESLVRVPANIASGVEFNSLLNMNYTEILEMGFLLNWNAHSCGSCETSGGRCGLNANEFICFCDDRPHKKTCDDGRDWKLKTGIGIGGGFVGILLMSLIFYIYQRRKRKQSAPRSLLSRDISSDISSVKDVEKGSSYHGVHLFTYEELVEATSCFDSSKELGDGGFGTVYYGKLRDGRVVAVKRLYENNFRRVEQFMNEVEILAHLRHKNLVSLYGCTSRHSHELLLVYEYVPKGTVADHLHGERAKPGALPWAIRLNIAVETASALKYLHASDVIHRDVKSTNILLDNNFSVKVADFGLSRLFPTHVTHVSTAPQGTPGYVDPEYHQCYQLTSKSDVFSFGVVLMELVSSLPAVDITRHRHDINLSTMAMNRILNHALHELVDPSLGFDTDPRVRKMITAVAELAFQCLQQDKDMRPCMVAVLDGLMAIQSGDYSTDNTEKIDSTADETVLLKKGPLSPDSVAINWDSRITTPNASG